MDLKKLFEMQNTLDERIIKEKKLEGQDLLSQKILALQVELGELAQEWRGFKFWSEDQEARTVSSCRRCNGAGKLYYIDTKYQKTKENCHECNGTGIDNKKNPLLEEYVDDLHFILSIGLDLGFAKDYEYIKVNIIPDTTIMFNRLFDLIAQLKKKENFTYYTLLNEFIGFGIERLGFTWEQIEAAYFSKNEVNHVRQDTGY